MGHRCTIRSQVSLALAIAFASAAIAPGRPCPRRSAAQARSGPWRLIAPGESWPARWVKQVESIRVVDAP
jgi:hypothetical protein